jgi:ElaA protein
MEYQLYSFKELSNTLLYDILALRAEVFVVEQNSPYLDLDGMDEYAHHFCVFDNGTLVGYSRLFAPKVKFEEASVGRIVLSADHRGNGLGRELLQRSMNEVYRLYGNVPIRIEAQHHLHKFYESLGFVIVSDLYDWGGIPHVKMVTQVAA